MMRSIAILATCVAFTAGPALAGNPAPAPADPVIAEPAPQPNQDWLVPVLALIFALAGTSK